MTIRQKLEIIQKLTGLSQTKIAEKIGVSFVAFNRWWTGKSEPRKKAEAKINESFGKEDNSSGDIVLMS